MKRMATLCLIMLVGIMLNCSTHIHTIGRGPSEGIRTEIRQWYVLWGLVPINQVDTRKMAENAKDYQIKTQASLMDVIINIFTNNVSVTSRTVTVTR